MRPSTTTGYHSPSAPACVDHGVALRRATCRKCNSAYMNSYLQARRRREPEKELWRRAKERASSFGLEFDLTHPPALPLRCPVLGITLTPGGRRRNSSPSLDRIDPQRGYIKGNVRVISDRANRLKGNRNLEEVRALSIVGASARRDEFDLIARYLERESLLADVRRRAENGRGDRAEWKKLADFLDRIFAHGSDGRAGTEPLTS